MSATVSIERITAKEAEGYLINQVDEQRKMRDTYTDRLVRDMAQDRWLLSPDAIVFVKGMLANGQHRLKAVVVSGNAQDFIVLRTDDQRIFGIMDRGIGRTLGDLIASWGYKNANASAACVFRACSYSTGARCGRHGGSYYPSIGDLITYAKKHIVNIDEWTVKACSLYNVHRLLAPSMPVTLCHIGDLAGHAVEADKWLSALYTGEPTKNSAFDFRGRLIEDMSSKLKMPGSMRWAYMIKSFNAFVKGERIKKFTLKEDEAYPSIIGTEK